MSVLSKTLSKIEAQRIPKKQMPWDLMVIPFEKEKPRVVSKEDRISFKLYSTPGDTNSITYEIKTYQFDTGSPEEWLEHVKTFRKICKGQNITKGEAAYAMLKRLIKGKTLTDCDRMWVENGFEDTMESVEEMIDKLTEEIFPERALQKQRRGIRRYVRKPAGMKTSSFLQDS